MASQVFRLSRPGEYRRAGPTDLVELLPPPGGHPLYVVKETVEMMVSAIADHELIHLSGPTGAAKSSFIEALHMNPLNFPTLCELHGLPARPLKVFAVEMATFEAPGELFYRRALKDGATYDEKSTLVLALEQAARVTRECYPVIWLREMGRVHSAAVQGGLLDLMVRGEILLHDGRRLPGDGIAWVADSNYQAEQSSTHTLVTLDDALKRRFTVNLTLDYLTAEQEVMVTELLLGEWLAASGNARRIDGELRELLVSVVKLGQVVRRYRSEGSLQSVVQPTIYGYLAFLRRWIRSPQLGAVRAARRTLLGNASEEDSKLLPAVLNEVWGLQSDGDGEAVANLF